MGFRVLGFGFWVLGLGFGVWGLASNSAVHVWKGPRVLHLQRRGDSKVLSKEVHLARAGTDLAELGPSQQYTAAV